MNKEQKQYLETAEEVTIKLLKTHLKIYHENIWADQKNLPVARRFIEAISELLKEKDIPDEHLEHLEEKLTEEVFQQFLDYCLELEDDPGENFTEETRTYFRKCFKQEILT